MMTAIKQNLTGVFIALFAMGLVTTAFGQPGKTSPGFGRLHLHGSVGNIGPFFLSANAFLEYTLLELQTKKGVKRSQKTMDQYGRLAIYGRAGYGGYVNFDGSGSYALAQAGLITGKKKGHFEGALGAGYVISGSFILLDIFPTWSLGYRHQHPGSRFFFRTGVGLPELLYFGIGLSG